MAKSFKIYLVLAREKEKQIRASGQLWLMVVSRIEPGLLAAQPLESGVPPLYYLPDPNF